MNSGAEDPIFNSPKRTSQHSEEDKIIAWLLSADILKFYDNVYNRNANYFKNWAAKKKNQEELNSLYYVFHPKIKKDDLPSAFSKFSKEISLFFIKADSDFIEHIALTKIEETIVNYIRERDRIDRRKQRRKGKNIIKTGSESDFKYKSELDSEFESGSESDEPNPVLIAESDSDAETEIENLTENTKASLSNLLMEYKYGVARYSLKIMPSLKRGEKFKPENNTFYLQPSDTGLNYILSESNKSPTRRFVSWKALGIPKPKNNDEIINNEKKYLLKLLMWTSSQNVTETHNKLGNHFNSLSNNKSFDNLRSDLDKFVIRTNLGGIPEIENSSNPSIQDKLQFLLSIANNQSKFLDQKNELDTYVNELTQKFNQYLHELCQILNNKSELDKVIDELTLNEIALEEGVGELSVNRKLALYIGPLISSLLHVYNNANGRYRNLLNNILKVVENNNQLTDPDKIEIIFGMYSHKQFSALNASQQDWCHDRIREIINRVNPSDVNLIYTLIERILDVIENINVPKLKKILIDLIKARIIDKTINSCIPFDLLVKILKSSGLEDVKNEITQDFLNNFNRYSKIPGYLEADRKHQYLVSLLSSELFKEQIEWIYFEIKNNIDKSYASYKLLKTGNKDSSYLQDVKFTYCVKQMIESSDDRLRKIGFDYLTAASTNGNLPRDLYQFVMKPSKEISIEIRDRIFNETMNQCIEKARYSQYAPEVLQDMITKKTNLPATQFDSFISILKEDVCNRFFERNCSLSDILESIKRYYGYLSNNHNKDHFDAKQVAEDILAAINNKFNQTYPANQFTFLIFQKNLNSSDRAKIKQHKENYLELLNLLSNTLKTNVDQNKVLGSDIIKYNRSSCRLLHKNKTQSSKLAEDIFKGTYRPTQTRS